MLANTGGKQEKPPWENMSAVLQTHKNQWYKKPLHWSILKTQPTIFFSHYEEYFTKQTPSSSCSCLHPARKRYKACPQTAFQAAFNKIPKIWVPFAMPYSVSRSRSKHLDLNISVLFKKTLKGRKCGCVLPDANLRGNGKRRGMEWASKKHNDNQHHQLDSPARIMQFWIYILKY